MILLNGIEIKPTIFPDGTKQVWKLQPEIINAKSYYCVWLYESDAEILVLHQLDMLLDILGIKPKYLCIPFLPYSRQDKDVGNNTTFGLYAFAEQLNSMLWTKIITFDVHSSRPKEIIHNLISYNLSYELLLEQERKYDYFILPDKGAYDRYSALLNNKEKCLCGEKIRDQSTGNIIKYELLSSVSLKGKSCLVIDDICDGGATFNILARSLYSEEEYSDLILDLFVTHGIFSKGLDELRKNYNKIYTTNSLFKYYNGEFEKEHANYLRVFKIWI
jgi:ribose-phosphate pyrophosphokinase